MKQVQAVWRFQSYQLHAIFENHPNSRACKLTSCETQIQRLSMLRYAQKVVLKAEEVATLEFFHRSLFAEVVLVKKFGA